MIYFPLMDYPDASDLLAQLGIGTNGSGNLFLAQNARNCYGLAIDSVYLDTAFGNETLLPGEAGTRLATDLTVGSSACYFSTPVPGLQTVSYYFASQTPYVAYAIAHSQQYSGPPPPLPGSPSFSVASTSPVLITGIGQPIAVSGWAKMAITNGYADKYAYLEQYFQQALAIDANGNVTTNSAGLLSPYGEFSPTLAGPAALVTMPDLDTGEQGTGVVNVLKLQLDVNPELLT
jgi:hypothetical protein